MGTELNDSPAVGGHGARLRTATVVEVQGDSCTVVTGDRLIPARYVGHFPAPRVERVSPGNLVALATAPDGGAVVVWRWYDAVVIQTIDDGRTELWEPAHGRVVAQPRRPHRHPQPGTRAYLSAGLPGADWWLSGPVVADGGTAEVELDAVEHLYTDNDLWGAVL